MRYKLLKIKRCEFEFELTSNCLYSEEPQETLQLSIAAIVATINSRPAKQHSKASTAMVPRTYKQITFNPLTDEQHF